MLADLPGAIAIYASVGECAKPPSASPASDALSTYAEQRADTNALPVEPPGVVVSDTAQSSSVPNTPSEQGSPVVDVLFGHPTDAPPLDICVPIPSIVSGGTV